MNINMNNNTNKKAEMTIGMVVIAIMAIIAGLALLTAIFDTQTIMTTKATTVNETVNIATARNLTAADPTTINETASNFTLTDAPSGWKIADCPLSSLTYYDSTGATLVLDTDYEVYLDVGIVHVLNTTDVMASGNSTLVSYTFCRDGYNKDAGSRSIAGTIGLFAALALVVFLAGYGLKEWLK